MCAVPVIVITFFLFVYKIPEGGYPAYRQQKILRRRKTSIKYGYANTSAREPKVKGIVAVDGPSRFIHI